MKAKKFILPICLFAMFAIYTLTVKFVDVAAIGPNGSEVGFSSINGFVASIFSYSKIFYLLTKLIAAVSFFDTSVSAVSIFEESEIAESAGIGA